MRYILYSSVLVYMLEYFPRKASTGLWNQFEQSCKIKETISAMESKNLIENYELTEPTSYDWLKDYSLIFKKATSKEYVEKYVSEKCKNRYKLRDVKMSGKGDM